MWCLYIIWHENIFPVGSLAAHVGKFGCSGHSGSTLDVIQHRPNWDQQPHLLFAETAKRLLSRVLTAHRKTNTNAALEIPALHQPGLP